MAHFKKGFTLIELLIVVLIIGILAAIAVQRFGNSKDKSYVAQMQSDLRNLATYEEQYAAENGGTYFSGTATMTSPLRGFHPSESVRIIVSTVAGPPLSWTASASHALTPRRCVIVTGLVSCG
jgi:prepilin-type N-terminal cleavage/methylation domain-containing protein